jgi:hypothetical protein
MNILLACECSGVVREAFRKKNHNAWSCDLSPSYNKTYYHYQGNVIEILKEFYQCSCGNIFPETFGKYGCCPDVAAKLLQWDMLIGFPPCTHLAVSGAKHFHKKKSKQQKAIEFFLQLANAPIKRICIENPVGIMSTVYRKPDQIIQPYMFGDPYQKTTCLWLKGLPKLFHADSPDLFNEKITHVEKGPVRVWKSGKRMASWFNETKHSDKSLTSKLRSITFPGIAHAMAEQWS